LSDWTRYKDAELIDLINLCQEDFIDDIDRGDAFLSLCFRLREDLVSKCSIICKRFGFGDDVVIEIVELTFQRFGRFRSFDHEKCNTSNLSHCFRFYLYRIAKNLVFDYSNNEKKRKKGQLYDGSESIITELPNIDSNSLDLESRIIHKTLMTLPYSHRVIYLTYKAFEKNGVNLPRKLLNEMRIHLGGIGQNTVRTYKKEAIDKIEQAKNIITEMQESIQ